MTVDVFTAERFAGNPLDIVSVRHNALSQKQKQAIAREFNYSETVFLHDAEPGQPRRADIFTTTEELPFAGHPTLGTAHFIFSFLEKTPPTDPNARQASAILTKAGKIPIYYNRYRQVAAAEIPHNFHLHSKGVSRDAVITAQPALKEQTEKLLESYPTVSIVKGMTFVLVDLTSTPDLLGKLRISSCPTAEIDEEWEPTFTGCLYYTELPPEDKEKPVIYKIKARMIVDNLEDAATGSACCGLACHLALKRGGKSETQVFAIEQGTEMGRKSQIAVEVTLDESGEKVKLVVLSGRAHFVTHGQFFS